MTRMLAASGLLGCLLCILPEPGSAQLWFHADQALPVFAEAPQFWVGASYGRGLNQASAKTNAIALTLGRVGEKGGVAVGVGHVTQFDGLFVWGGSGSVTLASGQSGRISVQGGVGWVDRDVYGRGGTSSVRFPLAVSLSRSFAQGTSGIMPWVMPRLEIDHVPGAFQGTFVNPGFSIGIWLTNASGIGLHAALDGRFEEEFNVWTFGIGFQWTQQWFQEALRAP